VSEWLRLGFQITERKKVIKKVETTHTENDGSNLSENTRGDIDVNVRFYFQTKQKKYVQEAKKVHTRSVIHTHPLSLWSTSFIACECTLPLDHRLSCAP